MGRVIVGTASEQINLNVAGECPDGAGVTPGGAFLFEEIAHWRVATGANGGEQMALDEVMLRLADRPIVRIYRWARPEVTFGYPQRWAEARAFAGERPITRRCTGGGFVEHGADTTVALAVPADHEFARLAPAEAYRRIHGALAAALGGGDLRLANEGDCVAGAACFASPVAGDVLRDGTKVIGGAMRRAREGFLYQGSVRGTGNFLAALGGRITEWSPAGWPARRDELVRSRYGDEAWNRRR